MDSVLIREFIQRVDFTNNEDAFIHLTRTNWDLDQAVILHTNEETESLNRYYEYVNRMKNVDIEDVMKEKRILYEQTPGEPVAGPSSCSSDTKEDEFIIENSDLSFILPNIFFFGKNFFLYVKSEVIDTSVKNALEQINCLNWWSQDVGDQKLWPVSTLGDGNCLLHAVSIAMWGYHDTLLELRRKLYNFLLHGPYRDVIKRRWKWYQLVSNSESGLVFTEEEWEKEWEDVVNLASPIRRSDSDHCGYDGLEEIHILALSYLLRRPIIVIADTFLRNSLNEVIAPIPFGGIYIPIGCDPELLCKSPILLGYDSSHFAPLLLMERDLSKVSHVLNFIPLVDIEGFLLGIKFHHDPGENYVWESFKIIDCEPLDMDEQLNYLRLYMNVFNLYNSDEDNVQAPEKQKSAKQQTITKQLSGIGKSMSKIIVKKLSSLGAAKCKNAGFVRYEMLCAELEPKMGFQQTCLSKQYIKFAIEKFTKKQSQANKLMSNPILLGVGNIGLGSFKRPLTPPEEVSSGPYLPSGTYATENVTNTQVIRPTCTTVGCDKGSCPSCTYAKEQEEGFQEYEIGQSVFYKRTDTDSNSDVPVAKPLGNQTLYLANSTFYDDSLLENECLELFDEAELEENDENGNNDSARDNN